MRISVEFKQVRLGNTKNWLVFSAYVPHLSCNTKYKFEYCGTELHTAASLVDCDKEILLKEMQELFGYAPFDKRINEIKDQVESGARIMFEDS